jgi:hypothetical protein
MARFSQQMLAGLLNPSYQKELTQVGRAIGGAPRSMMMRQQKEQRQAEIQELLKQHANNPAKLQQLANQYRAQGNEDAATAFTNAATQATARTTAGQQRGAQGGLMAITQAASRGVPLANLQEGVRSVLAQGGTQADIMKAYKAGADMKAGAQGKPVNVPAGGALVSPTGEVLYERPFKPEQAPASKGIKTVTREDGSVSVLDADDGTLISTLPPPDTTDASQEASLNLIAKTTSFIKDVDDLMDPEFEEAGFVGGVLSNIPGSDAYDREKELLSIRARLGFEQIDEMKRLAKESGASGTGLGQISNIEFQSLQSTVDAIYVGMSAEAQKKALGAIKKHLLNVQQLASGVAPADAIDWSAPEYKATGYHQDPETGTVFFAPNGRNGTVYKLVDGKFVKVGA